jgi:hypothetical protein
MVVLTSPVMGRSDSVSVGMENIGDNKALMLLLTLLNCVTNPMTAGISSHAL